MIFPSVRGNVDGMFVAYNDSDFLKYIQRQAATTSMVNTRNKPGTHWSCKFDILAGFERHESHS